MQKNILRDAQSIYFIGIGGIGVSAVARMMHLEGKKISGSDMAQSDIIAELEKLGIPVAIGQDVNLIPADSDLVIYSPAVSLYDPKLIATLQERRIPALTYPQALHEISKDKYTIAVSGTHGKTTTTAMIAKVMIDAGLDPTVIVGSLLKDQHSNFIAGKSNYFVVEACEYQKSFLNITPTIALITNIDNDHLDFYKDIGDIQNAFREFIAQVPPHGFIITDTHAERLIPVLAGASQAMIDSSRYKDHSLQLRVPGNHNRDNAALVVALAVQLGINQEQAKKSLAGFNGTWRRFEYKGKTVHGSIIYDDYGHHPTEIRATLAGARELFHGKHITVVFQPHLYSRTKLLLEDFAASFEDADRVVLVPIYAAREKQDPTITSELLAQKIHNAHAFSSFSDAESYLSKHLAGGDVLITMGAGDIYKIGEYLLQ